MPPIVLGQLRIIGSGVSMGCSRECLHTRVPGTREWGRRGRKEHKVLQGRTVQVAVVFVGDWSQRLLGRGREEP